MKTSIRGCLEGSSIEPGSAVSADCSRPLPTSLSCVCGSLDFLSAAVPGHVPAAFAVLVTVPNADLLLDFLMQISAPIACFNIKPPPPVPLLLQDLFYGFAPAYIPCDGVISPVLFATWPWHRQSSLPH